jgi:gamma-glutamylcyclotransferase (GGCT)/AIG2-like uncharacterized protein YtfP
VFPLFAYGTLRDPEYQRELFGRTYAMQPARVSGFVVRSTGGGYLAATPTDGGTIIGAIVALDAAGYAIADAWEDRSVYDRIEVDAHCDDARIVRCFIYVRPGAQGAVVADARLTDRPRADVIADIRALRACAPDVFSQPLKGRP